MQRTTNDPTTPRVTTQLLWSAAVAALGGFLFGFDTAVISGTTDALRLRFLLDSNQLGFTVASALIGTKVRNSNKESIGKIDEIYLDKEAKVTDVVISVGGFLGVGSKDVAVKWSDITIGQEDNSVVLTTSLTKDALMALPDYTKTERRKPAPPETAAAPPARPAAPAQSR